MHFVSFAGAGKCKHNHKQDARTRVVRGRVPLPFLEALEASCFSNLTLLQVATDLVARASWSVWEFCPWEPCSRVLGSWPVLASSLAHHGTSRRYCRYGLTTQGLVTKSSWRITSGCVHFVWFLSRPASATLAATSHQTSPRSCPTPRGRISCLTYSGLT